MERRTGSSTRILILAVTLLLTAFSAHAENIRGTVAGHAAPDGAAVQFRAEELVAVDLSDVPAFQSGLELRLDIPAGLRRYQNSFALLVFRDVRPAPTDDNRAYRGTRAYMSLLPSRDSMFLRIPFDESGEITGDALTDVLAKPVAAGEFPLLITVLPVMKGIPDSAFSQTMSLNVTSLWKNEGTLEVGVANPSGDEEEIVRITIDGADAEPGEPITVAAGMHRVRVESSHAPAVEKNIAVEPGERIVLDITLDYRPPELTVSIPDNVLLLLDGQPIDVSSSPAVLETEPGNHTITYRLGDMNVSREFSILPGGRVSIELLIDINIVEFGESGGNPYGAGDGG